MSQSNHQEPDLRAAEYVLGTLPADEAAQLARKLETDQNLQAEVAYWEEQLGQIGLGLAPVNPPDESWAAIRERLPARTAPPGSWGRPHARPSRRSLQLWRGLAVAASIAAIVLAGLLYVRPGPQPQGAGPAYASLFHDKSTSTSWLVTTGADTSQMVVTALGHYPVPSGKDLQLWVIPKGGKPVASGVIPAHGQTHWAIKPRIAKLLKQPHTVLAVSLEVVGQSVENGPQGPVLWTAPVKRRSS